MLLRGMLITRNVTINGRRTSLRLERENWLAMEEICERESLTSHELCSLVDRHRANFSRTSAVRAFITAYFRELADSQTHRALNVNAEPTLMQRLQPQISS